MEKQTKLEVVFPRFTGLNNFHYALGLGVLITGTSYCVLKDNKVKFAAVEYELIKGKMIERKDYPTPPPKNAENADLSSGTHEGSKKKAAKPKNDSEKIKEPLPPPKVAEKPRNTAGAGKSEKSETKPATKQQLAQLTTTQIKAYFEKYAEFAKSEMRRTGVPASITMAQAGLEGRFGTSSLATKCNNHFGIKCFSKTCKRGHCTNKEDDSHKDFFINYKSPQGSFTHHSDFLVKNGYKGACKGSKAYKVWSKVLLTKGYATDPNYETKLNALIEAYELWRLDI